MRPSIRSLSRSAWPQWRAYSSIMWTRTSRSGECLCRSSWCRACPGRPRRPRISRRRPPRPARPARPRRRPGVGRGAVPVGIGDIVGPVKRGSVRARHHPPEPVPLHIGHVADQAEQGHRGRRHRPARQLARRQGQRTSSPSSAGNHAGNRGGWPCSPSVSWLANRGSPSGSIHRSGCSVDALQRVGSVSSAMSSGIWSGMAEIVSRRHRVVTRVSRPPVPAVTPSRALLPPPRPLTTRTLGREYRRH